MKYDHTTAEVYVGGCRIESFDVRQGVAPTDRIEPSVSQFEKNVTATAVIRLQRGRWKKLKRRVWRASVQRYGYRDRFTCHGRLPMSRRRYAIREVRR